VLAELVLLVDKVTVAVWAVAPVLTKRPSNNRVAEIGVGRCFMDDPLCRLVGEAAVWRVQAAATRGQNRDMA
jgi:hypothetical protein